MAPTAFQAFQACHVSPASRARIYYVDEPDQAASNCGVQPGPPPDMVSFSSRRVSARTRWLTVVVLLSVALAWAIITAMQYRADVTSLGKELRAARRSASTTIASPVALSVSTAALRGSGTLRGAMRAVTASSAGGLRTVLVTADITGAKANTRYDLFGGDCAGSTAARIWASGVTNADGSAQLTGPSLTIPASYLEYYFSLGLPGRNSSPGPAAHGFFGQAHGLSSVRPEIAPCAP